jgi:hypothetical protein
MAGRTATRTPEPPDRDEHEESPPRLLRPRRTTGAPSNYARDQEIDNEQRTTRSQLRKKPQDKPATQRDATASESDGSATESEDLDTATLVKELVKLRREIRRRDELHKTELQKLKKNLVSPLPKSDTNYRPCQIAPRHRKPTPSHALRTTMTRSFAKYNPYAMQSAFPSPPVPRPMQMLPALLHSVSRATYERSQHRIQHQPRSPTRYIAR